MHILLVPPKVNHTHYTVVGGSHYFQQDLAKMWKGTTQQSLDIGGNKVGFDLPCPTVPSPVT